MKYKVIKLPKYEYPEPRILRQLSRMHVTEGLIYDTYKALVEKQAVSYKNEDIIFDIVKSHYAFYIIDKNNPETIAAWGLVIKGSYSEDPKKNYIVGHYYTREKFRGEGLGTILFKESIKISKRNSNCPILVYPCNSNKWYFRKMKDRFPDANIQNVYKVDGQMQIIKKKAAKSTNNLNFKNENN